MSNSKRRSVPHLAVPNFSYWLDSEPIRREEESLLAFVPHVPLSVDIAMYRYENLKATLGTYLEQYPVCGSVVSCVLECV